MRPVLFILFCLWFGLVLAGCAWAMIVMPLRYVIRRCRLARDTRRRGFEVIQR